ncbi:NfeD family protein [Halopseudomonas pelagia]|uniref:NfeD family protein n=1 Tax=Halopseudomonas pelagia TaxID=553151 RepID=UPI00039FFFE2|nr:NfeD family protein [Halopseudomonas pelagia]|tara:strand:- start:498 stop:959 length:462 start_codon:yes stop_codon:yes gene_type:complete
MVESTLFNGYAFWLLLGLLLLASEFFVPGLIAAFFGLGALVVGLLTLLGIIESASVQLICFAAVSLVALFGLRRHCQRWLKGTEGDRSLKDMDDAGFIGARVQVLEDFVDGVGDVLLNGAKWDAESNEALIAGEHAWVTDHNGIVLKVSRQRP